MKKITCNESDIRINKFLADNNICSRREADKLIENNKVRVNLKRKNNDQFVIASVGDRLTVGDIVTIDTADKINKYFIYNKEPNILSPLHHENAGDIVAINTLETESSGLVLYTNDRRINNKIQENDEVISLETEYIVKVKEKCSERIQTLLLKGLDTQEGQYKGAKKVTLTGENLNTISLILIEDKKHIVKRLMNALFLTVGSIKRVRFMNIKLTKVNMGEWRELNEKEVADMLNILKI